MRASMIFEIQSVCNIEVQIYIARKFSIVWFSLIDVTDVIARLYLLLDGVDFFLFECVFRLPQITEKAILSTNKLCHMYA